jgi:hypothetical protein
MLSLMIEFRYGKSCVLENVIGSVLDGKATSISVIKRFRTSGLLRRRNTVKVAVVLVVSLPDTLQISEQGGIL